MIMREIEVLAEKTLGDSGTETIDIDALDPFTKLTFAFGLTNESAVAHDVPPHKSITKIEIVDGGRPWFSLTGREAFALAAYQMGHFPKTWLMAIADLGQSVKLPIHFGRYVGDPEFGLDPTKLTNPQIKFTYAKDDLHLAGSLTLGVFGTVMDGVPSPPQCLMTRSIREFTTVGSGVEPTDIWTDNPIRRLFVQACAQTEDCRLVINNFKLVADDKVIFFDLSNEELREECEEAFGLFTDRQYLEADNSVYRYSRLGNVEAVSVASEAASKLIGAWPASFAAIFITACDTSAGALTGVDMTMVCKGTLPESVYCIPFGVADDPTTWLRASQYKKLKLELTQGVAGSTCGVFVQQPVVLTRS